MRESPDGGLLADVTWTDPVGSLLKDTLGILPTVMQVAQNGFRPYFPVRKGALPGQLITSVLSRVFLAPAV
jgi:hypothetical protein